MTREYQLIHLYHMNENLAVYVVDSVAHVIDIDQRYYEKIVGRVYIRWPHCNFPFGVNACLVEGPTPVVTCLDCLDHLSQP